jgi:hypothetical protein
MALVPLHDRDAIERRLRHEATALPVRETRETH